MPIMKRIKARTIVISSSRSAAMVKYVLKCEMLTFSLFIWLESMLGSNCLALDNTFHTSSYDTCVGYRPIDNDINIVISNGMTPISAHGNKNVCVVG
ncbi:hypothetical protein GIB67_015312, partial [Kingdonia uniflora]